MGDWLNKNQQKIAVGIGYVLVFFLAFGLGKISTSIPNPPEILIEEPDSIPSNVNSTPETKGIQTLPVIITGGEGKGFDPVDGQCAGKIKGNIGSSGKIYHIPGGSFYDRTDAERCFSTEADAIAEGFRKSSR